MLPVIETTFARSATIHSVANPGHAHGIAHDIQPRRRLPHLAKVGITAALITALATPPALAWGDKEQNFLAGVATTLLITSLLSANKPKPAPVYVPPAPPPVHYTPAPSYSSIYATPAAQAFNSYKKNERKRIQSTLAAYGYYRGSIDGEFGSGTYNAVTAFATNTGKTNLLTSQAGAFTIYDGLLF